jgi:hypothetical protein
VRVDLIIACRLLLRTGREAYDSLTLCVKEMF